MSILTSDYLTELLLTHTNKITANKKLLAVIDSALPASSISYVTVKHKIWHILHNISHIPTCPVCSVKNIKWDKSNNSYTKTCGYKCSTKQMSNDSNVRKKTKKTNIERYGGNAPACSVNTRTKMINTNVDRYGDDYVKLNSDLSKAAIKIKFGVDNVSKLPEIKCKKIQTSIDNYGVTHPKHHPGVQLKFEKTLQYKYGVQNINQIHIPSNTLLLLQNKSYLHTQHIDKEKPIREIANMLQVSHVCVSQALDKHNIPKRLYNNKISTAEQQIYDFIQTLNILAVQSDRKLLQGKELDIFLPDYNIAIEYCGLYWHSDVHDRISRNYHKDKMDGCNTLGVRLITIFEDEWIYHQQQVKHKLLSILQQDVRPVVYGRHTETIKISTNDKRRFFDENHIQGNGPGSINVGLEYDNELVACMSFIKQQNDVYCLNRYATAYRVVGGFSKLLKYFKDNHRWCTLISFADCRWSDGNLYERTGWTLDKTLAPDYSYIRKDKRIHKFNYRRKNLPKLLTHFDSNLSELENCDNNGILRIWDCGKKRYILNN